MQPYIIAEHLQIASKILVIISYYQASTMQNILRGIYSLTIYQARYPLERNIEILKLQK
jgi:hypothetical protein